MAMTKAARSERTAMPKKFRPNSPDPSNTSPRGTDKRNRRGPLTAVGTLLAK